MAFGGGPEVMHRAQQAAAGPPQHVLGGEVLGALCEFLEAAVHVVLHAREVYPKEAFERCRIYATQVHRCRHPKVSEYVGAVVHQLKLLLAQGLLGEVAVALQDAQGRTAQRVVLHVERLVLEPDVGAVDWPALPGQFTNALTKLQFIDSFGRGAVVPQGCGWEIQAHCVAQDGVDMRFWEECPPHLATAAGGPQHAQRGDGAAAPLPLATPFKTIDVPGLLRVQVLLEEPG